MGPQNMETTEHLLGTTKQDRDVIETLKLLKEVLFLLRLQRDIMNLMLNLQKLATLRTVKSPKGIVTDKAVTGTILTVNNELAGFPRQ